MEQIIVKDAVDTGLNAWAEYGFAGLFVVVFVVLLVYVLWDRRSVQKDYAKVIETTTKAITESNAINREGIERQDKLIENMGKLSQQLTDLATYQKLRDQFGREGRR